jgi:hypothetical protein
VYKRCCGAREIKFCCSHASKWASAPLCVEWCRPSCSAAAAAKAHCGFQLHSLPGGFSFSWKEIRFRNKRSCAAPTLCIIPLHTPNTLAHIHTTDIGTHTHTHMDWAPALAAEQTREKEKEEARATMMMTTTRSPPPQCVRERVQSGMSFLSLFPDWWIPSEPTTLWPVSLARTSGWR